MRLIDADAALERFQGLTELAIGEGAALVKALIFAGLKSRSVTPTIGGWISVKDRLPEKSQYVLVSLVNEIDGHRMKTPRIGYHTGDEGHGWFIVLWNEWAIDSDFMVTHWMPLPEPPEEAKP